MLACLPDARQHAWFADNPNSRNSFMSSPADRVRRRTRTAVAATAAFRSERAAHARRICLSLPDTTELSRWNHPTFQLLSRTFATLELVGGALTIAVNLGSERAQSLAGRAGLFLTPYGRGEWLSADLSLISRTETDRLIRQAYRRARRFVAARRAPRRSAK
jgi:hypothetical protein